MRSFPSKVFRMISFASQKLLRERLISQPGSVPSDITLNLLGCSDILIYKIDETNFRRRVHIKFPADGIATKTIRLVRACINDQVPVIANAAAAAIPPLGIVRCIPY